jgi:hypothetical protein
MFHTVLGENNPFGDTFDVAAPLAVVVEVGVMRLVWFGVSLRGEVTCH